MPNPMAAPADIRDNLESRWVGIEHVWRMRRSDGTDILIVGEKHDAPSGASANAATAVCSSQEHGIFGLLLYLIRGGDRANVYGELSRKNRAELVTMREHYDRTPTDINAVIGPIYSTISRFFYTLAFRCVPETRAATIFCNVRHSEVFCIFSLIYMPNRFSERYLTEETLNRFTTTEELSNFVKGLVRRMERAFTEHITNSKDMLAFWESMVLPDREVPSWYSDITTELSGYSVLRNSLKERLTELRAKNVTAYRKVTEFYFEILGRFLRGSDRDSAAASDRKHTRVMAKLRRRAARNADMTPAMMRDQRLLTEYFGEMLALVQDLYMCVRYELERTQVKRHVFLVGNLHSRYLCWYLEKREGAAFYGWSSEKGSIVPTVIIGGPPKAVSEETEFYSVDRLMQEYINDPSPAI